MIRVCVADDEQSVRQSIVAKLRRLDRPIEVFDVGYGEEALRLIELIRPELLFTDILMPGLTGLDILAELRRRGLATEVAVISGYEDFEYAREALRHRAIHYLLKPVDRDGLLEVIDRVIDGLMQRWRAAIKEYAAALAQHDLTLEDVRPAQLAYWFDDSVPKRIEWRHGEPAAHADDPASSSANGPVNGSADGHADNPAGSPAQADTPVDVPAAPHADNQAAVPSDILFTFVLNGHRGCVRKAQAHEPDVFHADGDIVACLLRAEERWQAVHFFGSARIHASGSPSPAYLQELRAVRESLLEAAAAVEPEQLAAELARWFALTERLPAQAAKRECAKLLALAEELYTVKSKVPVFEEEKIRYWLDWVKEAPDWATLKEKMARLIVGGLAVFSKGAAGDKHDDQTLTAKALKIIRNSADPHIGLDGVAAELGVHPVTLSRAVKQQTGKNFIDHVVEHKMRRGKIVETDKSIADIAYEVGYADPRYFSKLFKKTFGLTPNEYRAKNFPPGG
jgi:two-component system response regulator YesN